MSFLDLHEKKKSRILSAHGFMTDHISLIYLVAVMVFTSNLALKIMKIQNPPYGIGFSRNHVIISLQLFPWGPVRGQKFMYAC